VAYLRKIDADKQMEVMKRPPRRIVHLWMRFDFLFLYSRWTDYNTN
jgi:hypothetical protein